MKRAERPPARFTVAGVRTPKPRLRPEAEARLTPRRREVLDQLEALVVGGGFAELTMVQMAARVNCSLRTLYGIAPSKDELVLAVMDRRLRRIGRRAIEAIGRGDGALDSLRRYLRAVNEALQPATIAFAREFEGIAGSRELIDAHEAYIVAVARKLVERAIAEGEIAPVDPAALAHVLGGLGREFAQPRVASVLAQPAQESANAVTEIVLRGLLRK